MRWYADDTDLRTISEVHVPNIVLFGGIVVDKANEKLLRDAIENAKSKFCHKRSPIKWNFKDLKLKYDSQKKSDAYNDILNNMIEVRKEIFDAVSEIDFTIIIAMVRGYSENKKTLKDLKSNLSQYVFSNSMMRYALYVQEKSPERAEVILDWPSGSDSKPFDIEYAAAYNGGITKDRQKYHAGSLANLNFHDSIFYTRMPHSTLMQLSDMIIGATREFILCSLQNNEKGQGINLLKKVAPKFRGYPHNVIGRGISINAQATEDKRKITRKFRELYVDNL
ncbi:MAG: hypothetical protein LGB78_08980 [Sulfurovum sp.]|nr:hypothetical protein [Sulfurovum sp.]